MIKYFIVKTFEIDYKDLIGIFFMGSIKIFNYIRYTFPASTRYLRDIVIKWTIIKKFYI